MIKAIVFDKDGTVLDYNSLWGPVTDAAVFTLLEKRGLPKEADAYLQTFGDDEGIRDLICHGTYQQAAENVNRRLTPHYPDFVPFSTEEVEKAFADNIHVGRVVPPCENVRGVFEALKAKGYFIGLVTNDSSAMAEYCLTTLGIREFFDCVYGDEGEDCPAKPDPYYMNDFCGKLGLEPSRVLMVGDMPTDMRFARNSGSPSLGIALNAAARERIRPLTDRIVHDISEIFYVLPLYEGEE